MKPRHAAALLLLVLAVMVAGCGEQQHQVSCIPPLNISVGGPCYYYSPSIARPRN